MRRSKRARETLSDKALAQVRMHDKCCFLAHPGRREFVRRRVPLAFGELDGVIPLAAQYVWVRQLPGIGCLRGPIALLRGRDYANGVPHPMSTSKRWGRP